MPDYKKMYLALMDASEQAIQILITAQQQCEDYYLNSREPVIDLVAKQEEKKQPSDDP